eukprot:684437-Hanusia_phi.AAC.3
MAEPRRPAGSGIGLLLHQDKERRVTVRGVRPGSLADLHGLRSGSEILAVQHEEVAPLRLSLITRKFADVARGVHLLLRSPQGTLRSMTLRADEEMMQVM